MAEVVTGEAVVLEVPCARFPSRLLALVLDLLIQGVLLFFLFVVIGVSAESGTLNGAAEGAVALTGIVGVLVGYPVIWETLTRGRSPGKFALGLRVVSDDGGPERFRQALVRGLASAVEIYALFGCPALISSLLSARGKRLGDLFAGTFVIQQRLPARRTQAPPQFVTPQLAQWATGLEMSALTERTADTARRYLARLNELTPAAQLELGARIVAEVSAQVSPPPPERVPAPAYLSAVLAERRNREQARLKTAPPAWHSPPPNASQTTPPYPPPTAPYPPPTAQFAPPSAPYVPPTAPHPEHLSSTSAAGTQEEREASPGEPPTSTAGGFAPPV